MSLKKIEQIKEKKWFSLWDLIAYGAIIVIAVVLILAFTSGGDKSQMEGFYLSYGGERVFTYDFENRKSTVLSEENIEIIKEGENGFTVRFYIDGKSGYNDIAVDIGKRTVTVTASNCSTHKDCVYTPALKNNSSTPIICTPHALTVCPLKFIDDGQI